jgi:hypothetical protein
VRPAARCQAEAAAGRLEVELEERTSCCLLVCAGLWACFPKDGSSSFFPKFWVGHGPPCPPAASANGSQDHRCVDLFIASDVLVYVVMMMRSSSLCLI